MNSRTRTTCAALALAAAGLVLVGPAGPASSSYPGTPGRVFFSSDRAGGMDIWSMNADGTRLAQLTSDGSSTSPAVSPDGTRVAFIASGDVWTMTVDGTHRVQVTDTAAAEQSPTWSPGGGRVAYVATGGSDGGTDQEIFVRSADGTGSESQLTVNAFPDTRPNWSPPLVEHPDGRIAFVSSRTGDTDRNIYVMETTGSHVVNLTPAGTYAGLPYQGHDDDPSWSPDGRIAYTHSFLPNAGGLPAVWAINADGSGKARLSTDSTTSATDPVWSPDGQRLAYVGTVGTDRNIGVMTADGQAHHIDTATSHDIAPDWQEDSVDPETSLTTVPATGTTEASTSLGFISSEPGSTFECRLDHGAFSPCVSTHQLNALGLGTHTFDVRAIDPVGRLDLTPATHTWTVLAPDPTPTPTPTPDPTPTPTPTPTATPTATPTPTPTPTPPVEVAPEISVAVAKRIVLRRTGGVIALAVQASPVGSRVKVKVQALLDGEWTVIVKDAWTVADTRAEKVRLTIPRRWRQALGAKKVKSRVEASAKSPEGATASATKTFALYR